MEGSVLLHRQLLESSVFANEKRLKIWIWLLLKASFKERHLPIQIGRGQTIVTLKRGQLLFGKYKAEEILGIDSSTIYKVLKWMEKENMIELNSNHHYTIINIINYDTYQTFNKEQVTTKEPPSVHQVATKCPPSSHQVTHTIKNKKENKVNKVNIIYLQLFEKILPLFSERLKPNNESTKEKWIDCIRLLVESDGYDIIQIEEIITWARGDSFWSGNFLSILKLRNKNKEGIKYIEVFKNQMNGKNRTNIQQNKESFDARVKRLNEQGRKTTWD